MDNGTLVGILLALFFGGLGIAYGGYSLEQNYRRIAVLSYVLGGGFVAAAIVLAVIFIARPPNEASNAAVAAGATETADTSPSGLIQGYGDCTVNVDGGKLSEWRDKYQVALICGYNDPATDKYLAQTISISALYSIRPEPILITVKRSPRMAAAIAEITVSVTKDLPKPPPGQVNTARVPIWNEIVLFPAGLDISEVQRLADVHEKGGMIMSQKFPRCTLCNSMFMATEIAPPPRQTPKNKAAI